MREQRRAARKDFLARVQVLWQSDIGQLQQKQGMTDDLSPSGIAVRVRCPVPVGNRVDIQLANKTYVGIIRRCVRRGAEHLLGIEFCESTPFQHPPKDQSDVTAAQPPIQPLPETHQVEKPIPRWLREK